MRNLPIPNSSDNFDVAKTEIKRLKQEAIEKKEGIHIHLGKNNYIIVKGKKEAITELTQVSMIHDDTNFFLYKNNRLIASNLFHEITDESELNLFIRKSETNITAMPKYSLHLSDGKIYKHFDPSKRETELCPDWVSTYYKTEHYHGLMHMEYEKNSMSPNTIVYHTPDGKVGYTYKLLLNAMTKLAINFQSLKYQNSMLLEGNNKGEGFANNG